MEKEVVLAKLRTELTLTKEFQTYLEQFDEKPNAWFAVEHGNLFLSESGGTWDDSLSKITKQFYIEYLENIGISEKDLISVKITDSYSGSWIMEAALTFFGTVGGAYTILKGASELTDIADGLERTKKTLQKELSNRFNTEIRERIEPLIGEISKDEIKRIPNKVVSVNYSINARPIRDLTSDKSLSHSIHLSVSISLQAIVIENLSTESLQNLNIGIFKSKTERHNWGLNEAYVSFIPMLSGNQSISVALHNFTYNDESLSLLDILDPDVDSMHIDCWIQDNKGIYLFNFLLDTDNCIS